MCVCVFHCMYFQVNKSSSDFWNNLNVTWLQCADLPEKRWVSSVAELDGKVYVSGYNSGGGYPNPIVYDSNKDQWFTLPDLPYVYTFQSSDCNCEEAAIGHWRSHKQ